jgi:DNA-binding transcriptional LysR family regulator
MNDNQLKALIETADCGSFSAAARRLGVTQPAVSLRLQTLERDLGVRLLERQGESVTLTPAGRICYDAAQQVLRTWGAAAGQVAGLRGQISGRLAIGASTIPSEFIIPKFLRQFRALHPLVAISLKVGSSREMLQLLENGAVDLCVVGSLPSGSRLDSFVVAEDTLTLIAPPGHPLQGAKLHVDDLRAQPFILREPGSGTRDAAIAALSALGLSDEALTVVGEVGSHEAVVAAVEAGLGLSVVSSLAASRAVADGRVVALDWPGSTQRRHFYCVTKEGAVTPAALAFRTVIADAAERE